MGEYFYIVNESKKQYLHPHRFGDGLKLMEFASSGHGTMLGLALLLRKADESGGGDFHGNLDAPLLGSWAGDSIVIVGDYDSSGLYDKASAEYEDISTKVVALMAEDGYTRQYLYADGLVDVDGKPCGRAISYDEPSVSYEERNRRWEALKEKGMA